MSKATKSEIERVEDEKLFWTRAVAILNPEHFPFAWDYKQRASIGVPGDGTPDNPSRSYELSGEVAQRLIDLAEQIKRLEGDKYIHAEV